MTEAKTQGDNFEIEGQSLEFNGLESNLLLQTSSLELSFRHLQVVPHFPRTVCSVEYMICLYRKFLKSCNTFDNEDNLLLAKYTGKSSIYTTNILKKNPHEA